MAHPARHGQGSGQNHARNNGNVVDSNYYDDYSSMSALASAAGVQGHHQQQQTFTGQEMQTSSNFPDLDSHLQLYNDLDPNASSNAYSDFGGPTGLDASHMTGHFGQPGPSMNEWYAPQLGNGIPPYMENFQQYHEQPQVSQVNQISQVSPVNVLPPTSEEIKNGRPVISNPELSVKAEEHKSQASENGATTQLKDRIVSRDEQQAPTSESSAEELEVSEPNKAESNRQSPSIKLDEASSNTMPAELKNLPDRLSLRSRAEFRPKSSIPTNISPEEFAQQCIAAAYASRLNPFALHTEEHRLLRTHVNQIQVTIYLSIRNAILRLWTRNPLVGVSPDEAAGCAKDYRWFDLADVAYLWLVRNGYINFGCVEVPWAIGKSSFDTINTQPAFPKPKTIVVIGAGIAGLGCARQLEGLFKQLADVSEEKWHEQPQIIVLEGRNRIGGRIYSHALKRQDTKNLGKDLRNTADMGAQIITGFEHGNPLNIIIRGQLALQYHTFRDNAIIYDADGSEVNRSRDDLVEKLYNDILDRASAFRNKVNTPKAVEGDKDMIVSGRDPTAEGGRPISVMENAAAQIPVAGFGYDSSRTGSGYPVPGSIDKLNGKSNRLNAVQSKKPASQAATLMGWQVKPGVTSDQTVDLDPIVEKMRYPTLGAAMDEALRQYQQILDLSPQDMRLINWHFANLEYANAVNVRHLSLGSWDLDSGNEFEGEHASIVGGYQRLPRAIWRVPSKLDVRTNKIVQEVRYNSSGTSGESAPRSLVVCETGEVIEADAVVLTTSLGVLKSKELKFNPTLPEWKENVIDRLGFGTLNKVVLVYEEPFWEVERDMFGLLRRPEGTSQLDQQNYVGDRGSFYLFWNCIKTSGRPMLVAFMAGDAAHHTETTPDKDLIDDATSSLRKMFSDKKIPEPTETIITRWGKDPFTRGSYSYAGPEARTDDYDLMAKPVGNLFFAGEATCGTHPATVHGAYLSGLRAAAEVVTSMLGPIKITKPLIPPKIASNPPVATPTVGRKRKVASVAARLQELRDQRNEAYEVSLRNHIKATIGDQPVKPGRSGANPFLLYQKDHWHMCKAQCDAARQKSTNNPEAKAQRNEIRAALGLMWREASEADRQPYLEATKDKKERNEADAKEFDSRVAEWLKAAEKLTVDYREKHPSKPSVEEERLQLESEAASESNKRGKLDG